jgi:two-component system phosphate regulon sensor histidine kinase PhoR
MTTRIFFKLLLTFVGLLVIAALGAEYLVTQVTRRDVRAELQRELEEKARLAEEVFRRLSTEEVSSVVDRIAKEADARVTIVREDGSVVADSEADPQSMENHASRPEFAAALRGDVGVNSRTSRTIGTELIYVAVPSGKGAVRLALPVPEIDARTAELRTNILRMVLLAVVPTILLAAWLSRRVSGQLSQIMDFARQLAKGNFRAVPPDLSGTELDEMTQTLVVAADQLRSMFDRSRRERSRFEAVVNGIGEGVLVVDRDHSVILSNPAMKAMFPQQPLDRGAEVRGWSHTEIPSLFDRVFQEGTSQTVDLQVSDPLERAHAQGLRDQCVA